MFIYTSKIIMSNELCKKYDFIIYPRDNGAFTIRGLARDSEGDIVYGEMIVDHGVYGYSNRDQCNRWLKHGKAVLLYCLQLVVGASILESPML